MRVAPAFAFCVTLFAAVVASACDTCRPAVEAGIFNDSFWGRLSIAVLPFAVVLFVAAMLHRRGRVEVEG